MKDDIDDLNDLVDELNNTKSITSVLTPPKQIINTVPENITDDTVDDFIYRKSSEVIQSGLDTIANIKDSVSSCCDKDNIEAYSKLITSVTKSIDILNKINIQKRKDAAAKELKQMSIEADSKKLQSKAGVPMIGTQNNVIVATRDEALKAWGAASHELISKDDIEDDDDVIDV